MTKYYAMGLYNQENAFYGNIWYRVIDPKNIQKIAQEKWPDTNLATHGPAICEDKIPDSNDIWNQNVLGCETLTAEQFVAAYYDIE